MKKTNKKYALKEMSKVKIIDRRSEKSIKTEREFLSKLRHPFIVNMNCAFQDYENLYLVMDLLTGGDLRYHLCKFRHFSEEETKFFVACLLLGLEYIHGNNIIHRDIKPENLVFDEKGYLRITDFGVAKVRKEDNSSETSGTPGYMAPEVLMAHNHSFPVDFFAIGVMGYEFMLGQRPYIGRNRKEIKHQVLRKQAKIEEEDIVEGWSQESVDFINNCLKRKDSRRLGFTGGVKDLKNHIWFQNYDWDSLLNKTLIAPFIPPKGGNYDKKYCEAVEKHTEETLERYQGYRDKKNFAFLFEGYTYINYELTQITSLNESNTRMTTNTKYSKPVISTNPSANNNKRKNRNNKFINGPILENNTPVFNTQKKIKINGNKNIINFYNNDNINIVSNHLLLSNDINEKNSKHQQIKEDKRNLSKYKIKLGDINNVNDTLLSNLASSSTSLLNINNGSQNIKKINGLVNPDKNPMRSSSVGHFNLENMKQQNKNSTKTKFIDINSNKAANNINILSNLSNVNDLSSVINNMGSLSNLSGEPTQMKINYNDNYLENNNSHRMKNNNNIDNKTKIGVKMSPNNSKLGFYLPQLNNGKTINHEFSNHNINPNGKLRNKLNISQFRFKINHNNNKKGFLNNKLLIIPGNNYQPLFKRSESSGFMNFGTNIPNKTKRGNRNDFNRKNLVGISNSLINNGYNYNNDKRLFRNASDLFH
jgi:serine/threonine protein kinase